MLAIEADTAGYFGHLREARELSRRAADFAEQAHEKEAAATYRAVSALRDALFGNPTIARQTLAITACPLARPGLRHSLDSCEHGDTKRAQDLADRLSKDLSEDTIVRFNYSPTLNA